MDTWGGINTRPESLNKYVYTEDDPVNGVDPSGHFGIASVMVAVNIHGFLSTTPIAKTSIVFDINLTSDRTDRQQGALYLLGMASPSIQKMILIKSNKVAAIDQVIINPVRGTTISLEKLDGLVPGFRAKARQVLNELNKKGHNLRVVWGKRTQEENDALVAKGNASINSKHLTGNALDFISRIVLYDNLHYPIYTAETAVAAKRAGVIWGGNFTSRWDPNHIED